MRLPARADRAQGALRRRGEGARERLGSEYGPDLDPLAGELDGLLERNARIVGTKGSIFLPDFQHAETMTLEVEGKEPEVIRCPVDINGFEYEIREASRCVKLGRTGSDRYTPQDSLALTRLMYDTRMSWGMKFVCEV